MKELVNVEKPISVRITTLDPYIIEIGVSLVDLLGVVRYVHKTWGNSSTNLPLSLFWSLLQTIHNNFVCDLRLAITLQMWWGGIFVFYPQITTVSLKGLTVKLKSIIRDKSVWNPKPRHNISPHESFYIMISNICQGFSPYPFGKIISSNKKIPSMPCRLREWPNNVQLQLCKRPRTT